MEADWAVALQGGSVKILYLKGTNVHLDSNSMLDVSGGANGGGGGRIFIESNNTYANDGRRNIKLEGGDGVIEGIAGTTGFYDPQICRNWISVQEPCLLIRILQL